MSVHPLTSPDPMGTSHTARVPGTSTGAGVSAGRRPRSFMLPQKQRERVRYGLHGVVIESTVPLHGVPRTESPADLTLTFGPVEPAGACVLSFPDVGRFDLSTPDRIILEPDPDACDTVLALFLVGPVLALVMQRRGTLVLHASAVGCDHGAVLFVGASGWGKSTLAAALDNAGFPLLADDVAAVSFAGTRPNVAPASRVLRLWPDSLRALGSDPARLPRVRDETEKRFHTIDRPFPDGAVPVTAAYVLGRADMPTVQPLDPRLGFAELVRHTYVARYLARADQVAHFEQCARLAASVPILRLDRTDSLSALPELTRLVASDIARLHSS